LGISRLALEQWRRGIEVAKERKRRLYSVKEELLKKSREAALAAVQIFNNPHITFKSEIFIVLMVVAWTYLLHAHYREKGVEYRHFKQAGKRRRFQKTRHGAFKHWELEHCLSVKECPVDRDCRNNLTFLIGLRHEIEHQMTTRIDDLISARFQACCLNYNETIKTLFGDRHGIEKDLSFSLQFSSLSEEQIERLSAHAGLPRNIEKFIEGFDGPLTAEEYTSAKYSYRVIFVPKLVNKPGQADRAIEFIPAGSEEAKKLNTAYAAIRETEKQKFKPGTIVEAMREKGYQGFNMSHHTNLWKELDAKVPGKGFGVLVERQWFWYQCWVDLVEEHCAEHADRYT
jgi:hypothetical protein